MLTILHISFIGSIVYHDLTNLLLTESQIK